VVGLDGALVEVEVDIGSGLPAVTVVGLPDAAIQESKERVRAAIKNSGCSFPMRRVTINLAPADLKNEGPAYDLPIALAVVMASQQVPTGDERALFLGELSLDGEVRRTDGILPMVSLARDKGITTVYVPASDTLEASLLEGVTVMTVDTFAALVDHLRGERAIQPFAPDHSILGAEPQFTSDFSHVKGQMYAQNRNCSMFRLFLVNPLTRLWRHRRKRPVGLRSTVGIVGARSVSSHRRSSASSGVLNTAVVRVGRSRLNWFDDHGIHFIDLSY
jgi:magnesium chelatase family protein